jgi:bifunctional non-homologous end joining protein LigD
MKATSFLLDGQGIVYDGKGMPSFDLLHSRDYDKEVSLCAFDLLELSGIEIRKQPLVQRKELFADFLAKVKDGIEFSDHIEGVAGHVVFDHACKLGHDGIVAKRKDLPSESGRSRRWIKIKNPDSPAMKRVDEGGF